MMLSSAPVNQLLEAFRSTRPTPGGGSAAALAGALGASLLAMVAGLPKPRAASDADLAALAEAGVRATALSRKLESLVDQDAEAYDAVVAAYKLPKTTEAEKAARSIRIQEALRGASEVPLEVMRACAAALEEAVAIRDLGNANAASDVGVGTELLAAGLRGARLNVEINLDAIKDQAYVDALRTESNRLAAGSGRLVINESDAGGAPNAPA